jgi:uncharacterized protein
MGDARPWRQLPEGLTLRVRLTPKAVHNRIDGVEPTADGPALKARVRAIPEDGKANAALEELIADWLDMPKRSACVTSGHKSRIKMLTITGDGRALAGTAEVALAALAARKRAGTTHDG